MNAFVDSLYNWSSKGIDNPEENEEKGWENTDDEGFIRTRATSAMMEFFQAKCVVDALVLLAEYNGGKKFWEGFLFSCQ